MSEGRPTPSTQLPAHNHAPARGRPDPRSMRIAFGVAGLAAASAVATAILAPPAPATASQPVATMLAPDQAAMAPVRHVVRYVYLKPGQTAPPQAVVAQLPAPTPRVVTVTTVTTRQSGARP